SKYANKFEQRPDGWSERSFGKVKIEKGQKLYHISMYDKIEVFAAITTCFQDDIVEPVLFKGYVYELEALESFEGEDFGDGEIRVDLSELSESKYRIQYLGTIGWDRERSFVNKNNFIIDCCVKYRFFDNSLNRRLTQENEKAYIEKYTQNGRNNIKNF
ncbi:MAG: hypothetical protein RR614_09520, partial [Eubacterium sp.]